MTIDLKALGFTEQQIFDRVVETVCDQMLETVSVDEDGYEHHYRSALAKKLEETVKNGIDAKINSIAIESVLPNVSSFIENITLQQTNTWGEKTGKAVTFTEYLVSRAENYLIEKVDSSGKDKQEAGYGFSGNQTRITYLVNQHLHYSISKALSDALQIANSAISKGIQETVKLKLAEITSALQITVKTK